MSTETQDSVRLIQALESENEETRLAALSSIRSIPAARVVRRIRQIVQDDPSGKARSVAFKILHAGSRRIAGDAAGQFLVSDGGSPRLRALLIDEDPAIRARVARCLSFNPSRLVPVLLSRALPGESDPGVQASLIVSLAVCGGSESIAEVVGFLDSNSPGVRAGAVRALETLEDPALLTRVLPLLEDPDAQVRGIVERCISRQNLDEILGAIDAFLGSGSNDYARVALYALRSFGEADAIPRVEGFIGHDDESVQASAFSTLSDFSRRGSEQATAVLEKVVGYEGSLETTDAADEDSQTVSAQPITDQSESLIPTIDPESLARPDPMNTSSIAVPRVDRESLLSDLHHESRGVRRAVARKIAATGDPDYVSFLSELFRDPDPRVRRVAREAAREIILDSCPEHMIHDAPCLDELRGHLETGGSVAEQALTRIAHTCIQSGLEPVVTVLSRHLARATEPELRARLVTFLGILGGPSNAFEIREFLDDESPEVRASVIESLVLLEAQEDAEPLVLKALSDPDLQVQVSALTAFEFPRVAACVNHLAVMFGSEDAATRGAGLSALECMDIEERWDLLVDLFQMETERSVYESAARQIADEMEGGRVEDGASLLEDLESGEKRTYLEICLGRDSTQGDSGEQSGEPLDALGSIQKVIEHKTTRTLSRGLIDQALGKSDNPAVLGYILQAASEVGSEVLMARIEKLTHSPDRRIRLALAQCLGKIDHPDIGDHLAFLIRDRDAEISERASRWIETLPFERARPGIRTLLEDGAPWCLKRGFDLLEKRGVSEGMKILMEVLERSPHSGMRDGASRLLLQWGDSGTLDDLGRLFQEAQDARRNLLGQLGRSLARHLGSQADGFEEPSDAKIHPSPDPSPVRGAPARPTGKRTGKQEAPSPPGIKLIALRNWKWILGPFAFGAAAFIFSSDRGGFGSSPEPIRSYQPTLKRVPLPAAPTLEQVRRNLGEKPLVVQVPKDPSRPQRFDRMSQVEDRLAAKGVRSREILRIVSLVESDPDYLIEVSSGRSLIKQGAATQALKILESSLRSLDADHLIGKAAVLNQLIDGSRAAGRMDLVSSYSRELESVKQSGRTAVEKATSSQEIPRDLANSFLAGLEIGESRL